LTNVVVWTVKSIVAISYALVSHAVLSKIADRHFLTVIFSATINLSKEGTCR
jgi:hypothetical protein